MLLCYNAVDGKTILHLLVGGGLLVNKGELRLASGMTTVTEGRFDPPPLPHPEDEDDDEAEDDTRPARVFVQYRMGPFGPPWGTEPSEGTARFTGTLVTPGEDSDPAGVGDFDSTDQWYGPIGQEYHYSSVQVGNLKLGRWRFRVESPVGVLVGACEADLDQHGINPAVNFQHNVNGCSRGFDFPGD